MSINVSKRFDVHDRIKGIMLTLNQVPCFMLSSLFTTQPPFNIMDIMRSFPPR